MKKAANGHWPCSGRPTPSSCSLPTLLLAVLVGASTGLANPADHAWSADFAVPGVEGQVNAMVIWNGSVVIGGDLHHAGGRRVSHIAQWNGTGFEPMGDGFDLPVSSLAVVGGTLYAAGPFTASGATPLPRVARWTGSAWQAVGSDAPDDDWELELAVDGGTLLLLGGFTQIDAPPVFAQSVAAWDGNAWTSLGYEGGSRLRTAARLGARLYVAGDRLDAFDGSDWIYDLADGWGAVSLAALGDDLYLAGDVYGVDPFDLEINGIARYDGDALYSLAGVEPDGQIMRIGVDQGQLFVVGNFTTVPGPFMASWDGSNWTPGLTGLLGAGVTAFARLGTELLVGGVLGRYWNPESGGFVGVAGVAARGAGSWRALGAGAGVADVDGYVQGLLPWGDRLIATGRFRVLGNLAAAGGIAAWDGAAWQALGGGLDEAFGNPTGKQLAAWNGRLVVAGYFTGAGGGAVSSANVAAWNGTAWEGFDGGFTAQGARLADHGGTLIAANAAGTLGTAHGSGVQLGHVARWDGAAWQTVGTVTPVFSLTDFGLAVWNGSLVYGGSFSAVDGVPAANIARWDGNSWSALGAGFNNFVSSVVVHEGDLYAAGFFTASGATPIPGRVARWDGSAWAPVGDGLGPGVVNMVSAGGKLYAVGGFTAGANGVAEKIAVWDGSTWSPLGSGLGVGHFGNAGNGLCVAVHGDGVYAGGFFNTAGDKSAHRIARWQIETVSAVAQRSDDELPDAAAVALGVHPNPFNPATTIRFSLSSTAAGPVTVAILDARGRHVRTLLRGAVYPAGLHDVRWNGLDDGARPVAAGVYLVRVATRAGSAVQKVALVR